MGLFSKKPMIVPEADEIAVNRFYTREMERRFMRSIFNYWDEMMELWRAEGITGMIMHTRLGLDAWGDNAFPIAFFAEYFRALKTMDTPMICMMATALACDKEGKIDYPHCFMEEYNPLVNFAIKIKPIFHRKNGDSLWLNCGMRSMLAYLHDAFVNEGIDESDEEWIYEESLWFNAKGKVRTDSEIFADIKSKVKNKELLIEYRY